MPYAAGVFCCLILLVSCSGPMGNSDQIISSDNAEQTMTARTEDEIYINLDCKTADLPRRFRKCDDEIDSQIGDRTIDTVGLADLRISGSGQFSAEGLSLLVQEVGVQEFVVVVDLRQESHGFVDGIALSWMDKDNKANKGLTMEQVLLDEKAKLENLAGLDVVVFPTDGDSEMDVQNVQSERQLAEDNGFSYVRFPVTNNEKPTDEVVDAFIAFVISLEDDAWLHFHCMEGVGRATMFMVLYDSMKNAKHVALDDIMDRQVLLGGKNLLNSGNQDRAAFIEAFYQYCRENDDGFETTWSQWKGE